MQRLQPGYDPTKGGGPGGHGVPIGATQYANKDTEIASYQNKTYTIKIASHVFFTHAEEFLEDMFTNPYTEVHESLDDDLWEKRYLLELCTTIKNSYYFENSEVLEKIIAWASMKQDSTSSS